MAFSMAHDYPDAKTQRLADMLEIAQQETGKRLSASDYNRIRDMMNMDQMSAAYQYASMQGIDSGQGMYQSQFDQTARLCEQHEKELAHEAVVMARSQQADKEKRYRLLLLCEV